MEGEPIDFDRGNLNTGTTIHIFNYLDNSWKAAVVQEIDLAEREILVDYDDGAQEWIGVDGRKICFPPVNVPKTSNSNSQKRRASSIKAEKPKQVAKKPKLSSSKDTRKSPVEMNSSKKSNSSISSKSSKKSYAAKKEMSKSSSGTSFLRLKFKANNKATKPNTKAESSKKRKRDEQSSQEAITDDVDETEDVALEVNLKKVHSKNAHSRVKEPKKEVCKLKIRIGKEAKVVSSAGESPTSPSNKVELPPFTSAGEKKIKTLLPKRSSKESWSKASSPKALSPEVSANTSTSLASVYPTANVTPTLNLSVTSSGYICPKQDCKKQFRNENLLMMHIKHQHREYRNMLQSMPNVADLAYARTVGEHIESPQASFLEKIAKLEEDKLNKSDDGENKLGEGVADESMTLVSDSGDKIAEPTKTTSKASGKKNKLPLLLAQLQGPPLVPPSISIQSDNMDAELSISQNKHSSVSSPQYSERSNSFADSDEKPESGKKSPTKKRRLSQLDSTDVINCSCGYGLEDGLMIQCDLCQCWQHGLCVGYENEMDVPSNYTCETCRYPRRCHSSRRYSYVQNWLQEGIMPRFEFTPAREETIKKREEYLKQSHSFLCDLTELRHAVRSLQVKIQILRQTPDHPKLYLWAKSWDDKIADEESNQTVSDVGPVPEAAINMAECRKHLSKHIDKEIEKADNMLRDIEEKIEKMEEPDFEEGEEEDNMDKEPEKYTSIAKQTLLMMLRDLSALQNFKYCER